ncbi:MAG: ATP-binding response regulator [Marinicella sp.]
MLLPSTLIFLFLMTFAFLVIAVILLYKKLNQSTNDLISLNQKLENQQKKQFKLDEAKTDAEAANLAKNRYLSGISHELRTPLNVVMGYAQLLENQAECSDPLKEKYTLMRHNCEHLAHLIEGILEFSAMESGKLKVHMDWANLNDLVEQINLMFKHQAEQKGLKFISQIDSKLPKTVKTDHKRLQQILINLLSNALKFTSQGQVEFQITYRNQVATFTIKDTGCGIASTDLKRVFEPFERIEHANRPVKGTGLGLPITQLLVNLLGGELSVKSTLDQGSEFTVKLMLPTNSHSSQTSSQIIDHSDYSTQNNSAIHIIVIDDEASHRDLLEHILQPYEFNLSTAENAEVAQQQFSQHTFSLAIVDVAMPGLNGWQMAEWISSNHPDTKILMLSANPRDLEKNQLAHDAYITKPVKINNLLHHLNQLLELGWDNHAATEVTQTENDTKFIIELESQHRTALLNMADIGHINGIDNYLKKLFTDQIISAEQMQQLLTPLKHMNVSLFKKRLNHDQ